MRLGILFSVMFTLLFSSTNSEANELKLYEMPGTEVVKMERLKGGEEYELYVKVPDSYSEKTGMNYPVIYFTDAVWHIEILSAATAFLMEDVILVGISWQKSSKSQPQA